jgi:DNA-binding LacI/PurR family transcriptional regulator
MASKSKLDAAARGRIRKSPGLHQVTAHEVASAAGVSQSMVSRAFTPGASISADARNRVLEAAAQLGYRPNLIARSLITRRSHVIGVAIGYMENQFYPAILESLSIAFAAAGYRILLFTPGPDGNPDPILDEVLRYRVDAIVLASTNLTSHFAEECAQARVPVVLLNRKNQGEIASSVTGSNFEGGYAVARLLIAAGHRRFAFVAGTDDASTSREREAGFNEGLRRGGASKPIRIAGNYSYRDAKLAARALLMTPDVPDAIFCANDHTAFAVMDTVRTEFGLKVGEDISIAGFDDVPLAAWPAFDLTTFSQPRDRLVDRVVAVTLGHLSAAEYAPVNEVVPGDLIVRSSTRKPPWK